MKHEAHDDIYTVYVSAAAVFSNYISFKKYLDAIPKSKHIIIDFTEAKLVDHTVMEHIHHYQNDYLATNGKFEIIGLENHKSISEHPLAAKRLSKN